MRSIATVAALLMLAPVAANRPPDGEIELNGRFIPGGIVIGRTEPGAELYFGGEEIQVGSDGYFLIGLPRDASGHTMLFWTGNDGARERPIGIEPREFAVTEVPGVPQNTLTPSEEETIRIMAEQTIIDAARLRRDDRSDFAQGFIWPVAGRVSGIYGTARRYNEEQRLRIHWGLDVAMPVGTRVVAPAAGIVTLAEGDLFYSGGTLFLDHGHGMISSFLHMSALHVEVGDVIEQGQLIGEIGATGRATGPHLDWRIRLRGVWVDPATVLPEGTIEVQAREAG
jgi:murein DD-endopeptidase MepM/ murein hydrolase activator NlpD